ncbi:MAG: hypothetical protein CVV64_11245 [Candidatus Wallbacteria bacterium HGW-Wallbacteria-1]|uniref:peptidylprolyl isomerase n=1 Tax=Candidatus Wallbacteria bacterium HGW-Wallbacteria-1 TaxID=2013854 RepID=A0A2N1PP12_9BACT|nr:MAG: hypothetical protein CVV64_11245 [Candidatus Wallbacteria bacterium HGW-Wallbacteria-1]
MFRLEKKSIPQNTTSISSLSILSLLSILIFSIFILNSCGSEKQNSRLSNTNPVIPKPETATDNRPESGSESNLESKLKTTETSIQIEPKESSIDYFMADDFILSAKTKTPDDQFTPPTAKDLLDLEAIAMVIRDDPEVMKNLFWILEEGLAEDYRTQIGRLRFEPSRAQVMAKFMDIRETFIGPDGKIPETLNYDITEAIKQDLYLSNTEEFLDKQLKSYFSNGEIKLSDQGKNLIDGIEIPKHPETLLATLQNPSETIIWNNLLILDFPDDIISASDIFKNLLKRKILIREGKKLSIIPGESFRQTVAANLVEGYLNLRLRQSPTKSNPVREPSEKELLEFYSSNLEKYTPPRTDWIQWITFNSKDKAAESIAQLKEGISFNDLAAKLEQGNQPPDGYPVSNTSFDVDFIVRKMNPGEYSKVIVIDDKWVIIKLLHRNSSNPISFENARPAVRQDLFNNENEIQRKQILNELRLKAVELFNRIKPWPDSIANTVKKGGQ